MLATQLRVFDHKTDSHEKHDGLVVNSVSISLQNVGLTTQCP